MGEPAVVPEVGDETDTVANAGVTNRAIRQASCFMGSPEGTVVRTLACLRYAKEQLVSKQESWCHSREASTYVQPAREIISARLGRGMAGRQVIDGLFVEQ